MIQTPRTHSPVCDLRAAYRVGPLALLTTLPSMRRTAGPCELTAYRGHRWGCLGGRSYEEKNGMGQVGGFGISVHRSKANPQPGRPGPHAGHSDEEAAGQVTGPDPSSYSPHICPKPEPQP